MKNLEEYCKEGCGRILQLNEREVCEFCYVPLGVGAADDYSLGDLNKELNESIKYLDEDKDY